MKIYTRTGDDGNTSLPGGKRIPKHHARIEALGSVDELISWIGLLRDQKETDDQKNFLIYLQDQLMRCDALLASGNCQNMSHGVSPDTGCVESIENEIDKMNEMLDPLRNLIIPGGNTVVSYCHIARSVCRRAERSVFRLDVTEKMPPVVYIILNRLSDYLFTLSRYVSLNTGSEEFKWMI